jgi:hypothetical protein
MSDLRDQFDCSPQQYHAGLDILWEAIEGHHDLDGETAYHKCAARIDELEAEVERLRLLRREFVGIWERCPDGSAGADTWEGWLDELALLSTRCRALEGVERPDPEYGLTKREYFAAKALEGILSNPSCVGTTRDGVSAECWRQADSLLAAQSEVTPRIEEEDNE